jgi:ABC-type multidrug transport system fused ATPase/permease subunit
MGRDCQTRRIARKLSRRVLGQLRLRLPMGEVVRGGYIPADMKRAPEGKRIEWELLARTLRQLRPHRGWLAGAAASTLVATAISFAGPYFVRGIADSAIAGDMRLLLVLILASLCVALLDAGAGYAKAMSMANLACLSVRDLRDRLTSHTQALPMATLERYHTGDLVSRLNSDLDSCEAVFRRVPDYLHQPLQLLGGLAFMLALSPKLTLVTCAAMPISVFLFERVVRPMQQESAKAMESLAATNVAMQDAVRGAPIVRAFNLQTILGEHFRSLVKTLEHHGMANRKKAILSWVPFLMLRYIPQLIVPLYGGYLAFRGEISIGTLLAFDLLIWFVFIPLEALLAWIRELRETSPALARCYEILDTPAERRGGSPVPSSSKDGAVEFDRVTFSYGEGPDVLDELNFRIPSGHTVALVGSSGCGKSTALKLLCGFHEPDQGAVRLFGQSISNADLSSVRARVSLVAQDTHLFPVSIAENIAMAKVGATRDEIVAAAEAANAHEFIAALPEGYDTLAGELGNRLSGGERQRIGLARAFLKDAPILLLDEPTASLDTESEARVLEAVRRLSEGRTTLVVSHRLSTLRDADEILVLADGRIRERGTHVELLQMDSLYRRFYEQQAASAQGPELDAEGARP